MGIIRKCNPNDTEMEVFVEDSDKLWLDGNAAQIKMQSLSNKARHIVISHGLRQPRGLALDPDGGYMFFSDWHESTSLIDKAWLDGSHRLVLVSLEKDAWPNGIVVDARHKRLYWAEGSRSFIKSVALDGKLDVQVFSESVNHPYSLTILDNSLYCNSLYGRKISVFRVPRHNESFFGVKLSMVSDSVIFGQMGVRAVSLNHIPEGVSPCQINNGGCLHICVKLPNGERSCVFPVDYELQVDSATCIGIDISSISVSIDQRIFWSSEGRSRSTRSLFHRAFFNGSGLETVYEGNAVNHVAVDWITSNVYWYNMEQHRIEMIRGDGRRHPISFFFVNYYNRQKITINVSYFAFYEVLHNWKIPLHGEQSGGQIIIQRLGRVNALAIDFDSELLVWSELDEQGDGVSISDFNGRSRTRLVYSEQLLPLALTVYSRQIYIANMNNNTIGVYNDGTLTVLHNGISHVTNLAVAHAQISKGWNVRVQNNGGYNDICVAVNKTPKHSTQIIALSRCSNCAILFNLAVDEVGRQLFVSCAEHGLNHASSVHVWRIKSNDYLEYIGVIVPGKKRSPVTNRPLYPRQIALFSRLNLLFYADDGASLPIIVRCSLNGLECIKWETPNLTHTVKLMLAKSATVCIIRQQADYGHEMHMFFRMCVITSKRDLQILMWFQSIYDDLL
ncbi:Low-density lipoprotein receptor-related protein [Dirofilaria immitis]